MSGLLILTAALAAQAATAPGTAPATVPATDNAMAPEFKVGQRSYLDLEGGAGYSTNPQLSVVNDQASAFGRVSLHAVHTRVSQRSTTLLSAYAEDVSYTNHHGSQQSLDFSASHNAAVSEQLSVFGDLDASYQSGGQLDTRILGVPVLPPLPGDTFIQPILLLPRGDFLSVTGREYRLAAHAGGTVALTARDNLSVSSGVEHVVFRSGATRTSYTTVPVSFAYDRQISPRTTIGARVVAADTEYSGPASLRTITPQLTARVLLAPRVSFDGAIGVSFSRIDTGTLIRHTSGLSASANLCGRGELDQYCARVAVDEEAATTAGPAKSISGGIDYSRQLNASDTIQFSLSAAHYSSPISVVSGVTFSDADYYRAAAAYTRKLSHRLFGGVNLAARKVTQNGPDPKTDLNASLFVRYRFGDVQ
jgi:hypothetical protein